MKSSKLVHKRQKIDRFYSGLVHEIAGPTQSGKSYLCYMELITFLHKSPGLAIIIDTNRTFSPSILSALIKDRAGDETMLDRVVIVPCLDIVGVVEAIQGVHDSFSPETPDLNKIGLVLIDNITQPVSLLMQNGRSQGHDLMVCLSRELTILSRLHGVCVLVINTTVRIDNKRGVRDNGVDHSTGTTNRESAFADVAIKPSLGSTWPHLMDYCLFIHPVPEGTRKMPGKRGFIQEVIRSRVGGVGEWHMV